MASNVARPQSPTVDLSSVLIPLLRDVVYRHDDEKRWALLLSLQPRLKEQATILNADFFIDEAEGYAFLRSKPDPSPDEPAATLPRLVRRYSLSYGVSLLLALLRKKLAEFDAGKGRVGPTLGSQLMLSRDEILETLRVFLAETPNEGKLVAQLEANLNKIEEMGFIRRMKATSPSAPPSYEVRRILKAFIDAQWLAGLDHLLATYQADGAAAGPGEGEAEGDDNG